MKELPDHIRPNLRSFVVESNAIEGIEREPTDAEIIAHWEFLHRPLDVASLERFVSVVQPGAELRRRPGMNVRVGQHIAQAGGSHIEHQLKALIEIDDLTPWERHTYYEFLHPFMDGNGRSGRVLWLRDMGGIEQVPLGFLHTFYYQTLSSYSGWKAGKG